jgi:hypothetical protein
MLDQLLKLDTWTSADWSALAAWATLAVAVAASIIAFHQVREARKLREEQAQPYVAAYMEPNEATPQAIDLVVRNFGSTVATDIQLNAEPRLRRTSHGADSEEVWIFDRLPVLVPGQEWRTLWDFGPSRKDSGLPDMHSLTISYKDSRGHGLAPLTFVLDWAGYKGRQWVTVYGMHDAAKALREMEHSMRKWRESIHGGLSVYVRDGDERDRLKSDQFKRMQSQLRGAPQAREIGPEDISDSPSGDEQ